MRFCFKLHFIIIFVIFFYCKFKKNRFNYTYLNIIIRVIADKSKNISIKIDFINNFFIFKYKKKTLEFTIYQSSVYIYSQPLKNIKNMNKNVFARKKEKKN